MALARFDVLLAPLLDIPFNHSRSALRPVEYSYLCGCPSIVSDLSPYDSLNSPDSLPICTKIKGFDTNDWMGAIENGITTMREVGRAPTIEGRFTMDVTAIKWMEAFTEAVKIVRYM